MVAAIIMTRIRSESDSTAEEARGSFFKHPAEFQSLVDEPPRLVEQPHASVVRMHVQPVITVVFFSGMSIAVLADRQV